jgi:DNA-binding response OmpR family regulator
MLHEHEWRQPVVVAEDDPGIAELICLRLETAGFRCVRAADGGEALDRIFEVKPVFVVLDLGMPRIDGFTVLEVMRKHPLVRHTPVLVLTARHGVEDVRRAIALGANDYLAKPFEPKALYARVTRLLSSESPGRAQPTSSPTAPPPPDTIDL